MGVSHRQVSFLYLMYPIPPILFSLEAEFLNALLHFMQTFLQNNKTLQTLQNTLSHNLIHSCFWIT